MFVTKKTLSRHIAFTDVEIKNLNERYWSLWHKHELLLKHLGLTECKIPETTELRPKGSPELGANVNLTGTVR